ncbi:MAG: hypothetical protein AAGJ93_18105, partial [Bacteroidota bacterium]
MVNKFSLVLTTLFGFLFGLNAQILDAENKIVVILSDGTQVVCLGRVNTVSNGAAPNFSNEYYYTPTNLRLSTKEDGTPEFIFLRYTSDKAVEYGGDQGGLIHFLMEWGLTAEQERELQQKVADKLSDLKHINPKYLDVKSPRVLGPVNLN